MMFQAGDHVDKPISVLGEHDVVSATDHSLRYPASDLPHLRHINDVPENHTTEEWRTAFDISFERSSSLRK